MNTYDWPVEVGDHVLAHGIWMDVIWVYAEALMIKYFYCIEPINGSEHVVNMSEIKNHSKPRKPQ